jgi:hypothetical protein
MLGQHLANVFVRHARKRALVAPASAVVNKWQMDLLGRRQFLGDESYFAAVYLFDTYKNNNNNNSNDDEDKLVRSKSFVRRGDRDAGTD